jgi:hypothetical protein
MSLATVILLYVTVFKLFSKYISYPESTQHPTTDLRYIILKHTAHYTEICGGNNNKSNYSNVENNSRFQLEAS